MYNESVKRKFLEEIWDNENTRTNRASVMNSFAPYEIKAGKDICQMEEQELSRILGEIAGSKPRRCGVYKNVLNKYLQWCAENKIEGTSNIKLNNLDFDKSQAKLKWVSCPEHLQEYLDCIFEPESEHTVSNTYRAYLWMAYIGMPEEDTLNVQISDFNLSKMTISIGNDVYKLYGEALESFKVCATYEEFVVRYTDNRSPYKKRRVESDQLIRGFTNNLDGATITTIISRAAKKARSSEGGVEKIKNLKLTYATVRASGVFYRMYEAEKKGLPPDFMGFTTDIIEAKEYYEDKPESLKHRRAKQLANEYKKDYDVWKEIYY